MRHELRTGSFLRWSGLDIPRAGRIDTQHRDIGGLDLRDDFVEWITQWSAEGEAEDGVDQEVCRLQGCFKVVNEGD